MAGIGKVVRKVQERCVKRDVFC